VQATAEPMIETLVQATSAHANRDWSAWYELFDRCPHPLAHVAAHMVVDQTRPELLEESLRSELNGLRQQAIQEQSWGEYIGRLCPVIVIAGLLLEVLLVGAHPRWSLGLQVVAGATIVVLTQLACAWWVEQRSQQRFAVSLAGELLICGLLAIVAGDSADTIRQKLQSYFGDPGTARPALGRLT